MEMYGDFAFVYDELMDNIPYEAWSRRLDALIRKFGVSVPGRGIGSKLDSEKNLVIDLGCGTGTLAELMYGMGYDVMGVDISEDMLNVAVQKKARTNSDIMYLRQDMRELELYGTAGTVYSACDALNYVLSEEELLEVFRRVNRFLFPGGIFIFDFNTEYKYRELIGDSIIAENREDCSFIWENHYDAGKMLNEYDLTVFVRLKGETFRRFTEVHLQRGYTPEQMEALLIKAGMTVVTAADADTGGTVTPESARVYMVAREQGKNLP